MTIENWLTIGLFVVGSVVIPLIGVAVVLWADVRGLKEDRKDWDKACEQAVTHGTRLALLESAVVRLEQIPAKLDRLFELLSNRTH